MGLLRVVIVLGMIGVWGCSGEPAALPVKATGFEQVKPILETYAQTGTLDSGVVALRQQLEKRKEAEPAKAEELLKAVDELQALKDASKIKAKASEILGKL